MADQTQRLEVATVRAEVGSSILYRFSNDAVDAAAIPTESGNISNLKKVILDIQTDGAEKISFATTIYPTTAAGLAATTNGAIFLVRSSDPDEIYAVYSNNSGTAVDTGKRAISGTAVTAAVNTATTAAANAQNAADTATARVAGFHSPAANDPTSRDDGTSLQIGDTYFNTTLQSTRIFTSSGWAQQALDSNYLSANAGAGRVGTTSGATVQSSLDSLTTSINNAIPGSAAKLTAPRSISATGDATWSASFDGNANATGALTLADTGVTAGTGVRVTVNSKGLVTGLQTSALALANGGTGSTNATTARSNLGAAASGVNADITSLTGLTTPLSAAQGGTGGNLATSGGSALVGTVRAESGAVATTVQSLLRWQMPNDAGFGVPSDGVTSANAALSVANALTLPAFEFGAGTFLISASITLSMPIKMRPGSKFNIPNGVTLTLSNTFDPGDLSQKFVCTGTGKVVFSPEKVSIGYPEWWGAVPNVPGGDCLAAINASIVACPKTIISQGDYYTSGTVLLSTAHRELCGIIPMVTGNGGQGAGSRIIVKSGSADVVRQGLISDPGNIANYLYGTSTRNLQLLRSIAPIPPASGSEINGCAGLRVTYSQFTNIDHVDTEENTLGITGYGNIRLNITFSDNFRSVAGSTTANDIFWGMFFPNGGQIGGSQANASLRIIDCSSTSANTSVASTGMIFGGSARDTFISRFECGTCDSGIILNGGASGSTNLSDIDIQIDSCIIDGFKINGILINNMNSSSALRLTNNYVSPASYAIASSYAIHTENCKGAMIVASNEIDCIQAPQCVGMGFGTPAGLKTSGNIINNSNSPVIVASGNDVTMDDIIRNTTARTGASPAINCIGTNTVLVIRSSVSGAAGSYPQGVLLSSTTTTRSEVNLSGVDSACITGGAANKLWYNGASVAAAGAFGTNNLASGVMA